MIDVAIVGAGIAGLACARSLARAGLRPTLFDKGRRIGGRVATRRVDGGRFDHGAQYVTARRADFAAVLDELGRSGAVAAWDDGSDEARRVGVPGMSALAAGLGRGLDVRQGAEVASVRRVADGWTLRVGDAEHRAARVVVTAPAPQAAALLGRDHPLSAPLSAVRFAPCLTLMAAVEAAPPFARRRDPDDPLAWIAHDGSKPGRDRDGAACWVAQAGPGFSRTHLETPPGEMVDPMLRMLCDRLGVAADRVRHAAVHRWRYALVTEPLGRPFLRDGSGTLHVAGDGCLAPRIEAAWESGTAVAADILAEGATSRSAPTFEARPC